MSKQLAVSSAFSIFALCALALFAPHSERSNGQMQAGNSIEMVQPAFRASLPALPF
jgi:hypothetical protein